MNLFLRVLIIWAASFFRKPAGLLDTQAMPMAVLPNDLDLFAHLNNGRALQIMDLGRFDLILRSPLRRIVKERNWKPVVASSIMKYRRPLFLFERYTLTTRIACWDADWVYLEQRLECGGGLAAVEGFIKGIFVGEQGRVPTHQIFDAIAPGLCSPQMPEAVLKWNEAEALAKKAKA
jgi:acyl-CoA thioesterase FadM